MLRTQVCTIYDIESSIPELYSKDNDEFGEPIGRILDIINTKSKELLQNLKPFFGEDLTINGYITYPIARSKNSSKNSYLKKPTILTDSTTDESDTFILTFTDTGIFEVTNFYGANAQQGDTTSDFTLTGGLLKILSTDWVGNHEIGDSYIFAYEGYEEVLRELCSYMVADEILGGRYVSESASSIMPLARIYRTKIDNLWNKIVINAELELQGCKEGFGGSPSSNAKHLGYNIDGYGILRTPPTI
jgi:hypothetical protein